MRQLSTTLLLFLILCTVSSCNRLFIAWYGIKNPKPLTEEKVLHYAKKYGADEKRVFILDTSFARLCTDSVVPGVGQISKGMKKQFWQLVHYILFDGDGKMLNYMTNCYAMPGVTGLKFEDGFDSFPPNVPGDIDTAIRFEMLQPYFLPTTATTTDTNADYICVVIWNRFTTRNSKRLIKAAKENIRNHAGGKRVQLYYVNNDNFFATRE